VVTVPRSDVAIIGAGQAGLAMSACLTARGIEHVLLERGRIGERWRSERWDSLKLLTPNWMTRLPGHAYRGPDPDGFMSKVAVTRLLEEYAFRIDAPISERTRVLRVSAASGGYLVATDRGTWWARAVVVATGACHGGAVPAWARALPRRIHQVVPERYRRPGELPRGGVLVVGASATGVQLAEEIHASGRPVTLAVGNHVRLPRRYRGRDIMHWMDASGLLDERAEQVPDITAARRQPSLQLVGRPGASLDLPRLASLGVSLVGRALDVSGERLALADDFRRQCAAAERRRRRLLARIDAHIARSGIAAPDDPAAWRTPAVAEAARDVLDLRAAGIETVLWATGYRRDYPWLDVPVLDAAGELSHRGGVTPAPGLYALGLRFQRRRNSSFLDGVGRDAEELADDIARHLCRSPARAA
jgi:putative flavoprotein involved in K+ transport